MEIKEITSILNQYRNSAELKALSLNTNRTYKNYLQNIENHLNHLELFHSKLTSRYLGIVPMPKDVAMPKGVAMQIDVALLSRVVECFYGPQGQRMARRVLILLFNWAEKYNLVSYNPASKVPVAKLTPKPRLPFTLEEIQKLEALKSDSSVPPRFVPYINQIVVAFHTGMRPSELDSLKWDDVGPEFIRVRSAKHHEVGAVARLVRVTEAIKHIFSNPSTGLVFKSVTNKPLNKDIRSEATHYLCTKARITPREFYSTRRGTATQMFQEGYNISVIQHQLGHRSINTTQIYIKPSMEQAASAFRGF